MRLKDFLVFVLTFVLAVPATAQEPSAQGSRLVGQAGGLTIAVIEGDGAKNNIRTKVATPPVVEVRDEAGKPVPGAEVVFQLPMMGPSGVFNGWVKTQTVRTNEEGRATVSGYAPNDEEGRFNIKVTATSGVKTASVVVAQSNVQGAGGGQARSGKRWWIIGLLGTGALVGGVVAATRNGDSGTAPVANPVVITSGPVTVGGPR